MVDINKLWDIICGMEFEPQPLFIQLPLPEFPSPETIPSELPSIAAFREQLEWLHYLSAHNEFWAINPEQFPHLLPIMVEIDRFIATKNVVEGLQNFHHTVQDPELKEKFAILATNLIKESEERLSQSLAVTSGEIDTVILRRGLAFRQSGEQNGSLELALRLGLIDVVNYQNFPALRSLSAKDLAYLRSLAISNRLTRLTELKGDWVNTRDINLGSGMERVEDVDRGLREEIEQVKDQFTLQLREFFTDDTI